MTNKEVKNTGDEWFVPDTLRGGSSVDPVKPTRNGTEGTSGDGNLSLFFGEPNDNNKGLVNNLSSGGDVFSIGTGVKPYGDVGTISEDYDTDEDSDIDSSQSLLGDGSKKKNNFLGTLGISLNFFKKRELKSGAEAQTERRVGDRFTDKELARIYSRERKRSKKVYGVELDGDPLPDYVTPKLKKELKKKLGVELQRVPKVDIGSLEDLRRKGAERFVKELSEKYPEWKTSESLGNSYMASNHKNLRNFKLSFWKEVEEGRIDFPELSGQWIAVDCKAPAIDSEFKPSLFTKRLGFEKPTNISCSKFDEAIKKNGKGILYDLNLSNTPAYIRSLEAIEYNYFANLYAWKKRAHGQVWLNTEFRFDHNPDRPHNIPNKSARLLGDNFDPGGFEYASPEERGAFWQGSLAAVVLPSQK